MSGADEYVDEEAEEYCAEMCYRVDMESSGFCHGDDCIDYECYEECLNR